LLICKAPPPPPHYRLSCHHAMAFWLILFHRHPATSRPGQATRKAAGNALCECCSPIKPLCKLMETVASQPQPTRAAAQPRFSPSTALLIVDYQNDFVTGSLAVPGAQQLCPLLNQLTAAARGAGAAVAASQDWHPPHHVSFASSHGSKQPGDTVQVEVSGRSLAVRLFPEHCIAGTAGAEFAGERRAACRSLCGRHAAVTKLVGLAVPGELRVLCDFRRCPRLTMGSVLQLDWTPDRSSMWCARAPCLAWRPSALSTTLPASPAQARQARHVALLVTAPLQQPWPPRRQPPPPPPHSPPAHTHDAVRPQTSRPGCERAALPPSLCAAWRRSTACTQACWMPCRRASTQ
jgi:hypothetical protein